MKMKIVSTIFFIVIISFVMGQETDNLNLKELTKDVIMTNKIKVINTWIIVIDSSGQPNDTIIQNKYLYGANGLLKENQFYFSKDLKIYSWIKYFYNDDDSLINTKRSWFPYEAMWRKESYTLCNEYENGRIVETYKFYSNQPDKTVEKKTYSYNEKGLLSQIKEYIEGKLKEIELIEYITQNN
jgi:hypothetical protein